ncbi:hypothetical protein N7520_010255 [Penicillium odoratum]|uniref:uncharacterized protein n=1 Tax=Penicillium odoratum TaxID=1167516 RepID=UPI00254749D3|nr:uncharacterized protein N7520_010255 [Penicillium odoratum]KAJ5745073.1 hypothetical protein N7520_010255 [Penicillium odoratum]
MLTLLRSTGMTDPKDQICRIVMSIDATLARDLGRLSDKIEDFMKAEPKAYQANDQYDLYDDGADVPQDRPSDFPTLAYALDEDIIVSYL